MLAVPCMVLVASSKEMELPASFKDARFRLLGILSLRLCVQTGHAPHLPKRLATMAYRTAGRGVVSAF